MSRPSVPPSRPGKASDEVRRRVLAKARPMPELSEEEKIQLSEEEEARVFWDAITNA